MCTSIDRARIETLPLEDVDLERLSRVAMITDPRGLAADRFRFLRLRLSQWQGQKSLKRLLVTSPLPQDGKSTVALNFATALAEGGKRPTLLIDADLHLATLSAQLGFQDRNGLAECLQAGMGTTSAAMLGFRLLDLNAVLKLGPLACHFLPAGKPDGNPTDLTHSGALSVVMAALSDHFEWIVVDSPPVMLFTDALSLKKETDGALLVVRAGQTPGDAVETAMGLLGREHVAGIVLNAVEGLEREYSKYSKYYKSNR